MDHHTAACVGGQGWGRARAPPPARPHPSVSTTRGAHSASLTVSTAPPTPPGDTRTPTRRGPEEDTGLRGNNTTARPQAPEGRPGALQGHHRGSNEAHSHTHAGARSMAAAQPSPPRGGPLAGAHARKAKQAHLLCLKTHGPTRHPKAGDGRPKVRAGGRTPTPALPHPPQGARGKDRRGAPRTDREERTHSLGTPVPRPARLKARPGRARPHHINQLSQSKGVGGGGRGREGTGEDSHRRGPALSLTGNLPSPTTSHLRRGRPTTPGGERLTRGTEPTGRGSSQPPPGAHSGEHRVVRPNTAWPHGPRVTERLEVAPRAWSARRTTQEPAHRPRRAAPAAKAEPGTRWRPKGPEPRVHPETQSPR